VDYVVVKRLNDARREVLVAKTEPGGLALNGHLVWRSKYEPWLLEKDSRDQTPAPATATAGRNRRAFPSCSETEAALV